MKMILFGFLLCISCGDVDKKTNTDNGENNVVINNGVENNGADNNGVITNNNGTANNGKVDECKATEQKATVNGVTACYAKCTNGECSGDATCMQGICIAGLAPNNGGAEVCESNADCTVSQECRETCLEHLECFETSYDRPDYKWASCTDGKEYTGFCGNEGCECIVNGTVVKSFSVETAPRREQAHRVFNLNCDWLVPAI